MKIRHLADYQDAARDLVNPNGHYQFYERIEGNGSGQHYDINGDMIADTADGEWQCYDDHPIADFRMYVHPRLSDGRRSSNDYHCYTSGVPVTDYVAAFWAGSGEYYTPDNDIRWKIVRGGWELKVLQEAGTALDWPVLLRGHPFEWEQGEAVTVERRASGLFTAA
ncbi:MAG: hypothetical protein GY929_27515, partial [Actinomycetia bacterium]|nr:hypothetical protein [Actinomycetes bacterium]